MIIKTEVVYISSDLYSKLAGTSIYSLFENNKDESYDTYVVSTGIGKENIEKIYEILTMFAQEITLINGNEIIKEVKM